MQKETNNIISKKTPVPTRPLRQRLLAVILILGLLIAGFFAAQYLLKTKPKARKKPPVKMQTLVKTMTISPMDINAKIKAFGNIIPAREINLMARVSGEAEYLHPNFIPGGIVKAGEVLLRLDGKDYQLILKQRQNALAKALADLRIEQGNQTVAQKEWELINKLSSDIDTTSEDLALRRPQLNKANAAIMVAETDIEKALVDLARTEITTPFNAVIRQKAINLGSQVSNLSVIAALVDIDVFWAILSLPVEKVGWIDLPSNKTEGSTVTIHSNLQALYKGKIVNLLPDLDPDGMMARILVEIRDPMGLKSNNPPLPLGSFIEAEISGKEMKNVFKVPRPALQENSKILTATDEGNLQIKTVSVVWKDPEWAYIDTGMNGDTKIIISNVPAPVEGMPLEIWQDSSGKNTEKKVSAP